jgi:hypothetical protein
MNTAIKSAITASVFAVVLGSPSIVNAYECPQGYDGLTLDLGLACGEFPLTICIKGSEHRVYKEWTDEYGTVVRSLSAGKGNDLLFVNEDTGAMLKTKANGAVEHTTFNADGTETHVATGHNVIILFPSDDPPGPSTTLYVGRVVITVDEDGIWHVEQVSGKTTDICAALSQ